jgi:aminopeptidase-like protein
MNEELIDEVVGQSVDIYKVSVENTDENIYGESTTKYYEVGFRVNCLIMYNEPIVNQDEFGTDTSADIEMYFQRENLASGSLNFYPEVGDIVDWNNNYWEINGTTEPQLFAGHPNFNHQIKATAHFARMSSLQIEERPR